MKRLVAAVAPPRKLSVLARVQLSTSPVAIQAMMAANYNTKNSKEK